VALAQQQIGSLPAGDFVKVTVTDTGTGMPAEVAARAIEPFFTTKDVGKGTGMGLSQVYGLVQQSGGDLVVASEPGKGTAVSMYFPALPPAHDLASFDLNAGREKVLVVDDEPEVVDAAAALFEVMGYEVLSAGSGEQALSILEGTPDIDVLFTDVVMSGMNGLTLGRAARDINPGVNVILVTGYPPMSLHYSSADTGGFHLVRKPFRMAEIARMLRQSEPARKTHSARPIGHAG
jgi:CheY-like chemotaxis protein